MARLKSTISNPLHYARCIEIVKKARGREKLANKMWLEAENRNDPLHTENHRLQALVRANEAIIRRLTEEKLELATRLERVESAITAAGHYFDGEAVV